MTCSSPAPERGGALDFLYKPGSSTAQGPQAVAHTLLFLLTFSISQRCSAIPLRHTPPRREANDTAERLLELPGSPNVTTEKRSARGVAAIHEDRVHLSLGEAQSGGLGGSGAGMPAAGFCGHQQGTGVALSPPTLLGKGGGGDGLRAFSQNEQDVDAKTLGVLT